MAAMKNCNISFILLYHRVWTVKDGLSLNLNTQTCVDFKNDDNELWCKTVRIPDCVDRTILCSDPPSLAVAHTNQIDVRPAGTLLLKVLCNFDFGLTNFSVASDNPNLRLMGTVLEYECKGRGYAFDYPLSPNFVSFYNETNINKIKVTCTKDR